MKASTRLALSLVMIIGSALYGVLIAEDRGIAEAIAIGYIALLLTLFFVINLWKRS